MRPHGKERPGVASGADRVLLSVYAERSVDRADGEYGIVRGRSRRARSASRRRAQAQLVDPRAFEGRDFGIFFGKGHHPRIVPGRLHAQALTAAGHIHKVFPRRILHPAEHVALEYQALERNLDLHQRGALPVQVVAHHVARQRVSEPERLHGKLLALRQKAQRRKK